MDKSNPAFPRPASFWWFGCKSKSPKGRYKRQIFDQKISTISRSASAQIINGYGSNRNIGVGLVSDRSDVPPKADHDPGEGSNPDQGRSFSSFWNVLAKPFRGLFNQD